MFESGDPETSVQASLQFLTASSSMPVWDQITPAAEYWCTATRPSASSGPNDPQDDDQDRHDNECIRAANSQPDDPHALQ
jgi:hypothetical protein